MKSRRAKHEINRTLGKCHSRNERIRFEFDARLNVHESPIESPFKILSRSRVLTQPNIGGSSRASNSQLIAHYRNMHDKRGETGAGDINVTV